MNVVPPKEGHYDMVPTSPIMDSDGSLGELDECVQRTKDCTIRQMGKIHGHLDIDECDIIRAQVREDGVKINTTNGLEDCGIRCTASSVDGDAGIIVPAPDGPIGRVPQLVLVSPQDLIGRILRNSLEGEDLGQDGLANAPRDVMSLIVNLGDRSVKY